MTSTGWRVVLGALAWSAFFWGVAGAVDLGLARTRKGYTLPDGGGWYELALLAGFIVGYFAVGSLTDRIAPRHMALIPAVATGVGAASCLVFGQQTRHWLSALVLVAIGVALVATVRLRDRSRVTRRHPGRPAT
ncbi:hypothetical protein KV205_11210 [Streptomyces sp. SKN60]|uniref:hypothetical protein n=1 Tax=Streptomyces sp. SKN60 TaxID=2855506 RepID=UPI002246A2A7|nr:hypothetical protein [Streptomyces sp. SKN60]MCX2181095.1 hypothetical protein [Streptomyces sp. SKN60]